MGSALKNPKSVVSSTMTIVIGYAGLAVATSGILLTMDALECFLHALRLHW